MERGSIWEQDLGPSFLPLKAEVSRPKRPKALNLQPDCLKPWILKALNHQLLKNPQNAKKNILPY